MKVASKPPASLCAAPRGGVQFRSSKYVRGPGSSKNNADKLVSFFTQLTFLAVWRALGTLSAPVARVLALYIWTGRSFLKLTSFSQTLVLRLVGWLGAPAFSQSRARWIRRWSYVPLDVRKWHVVIGKETVRVLLAFWQPSATHAGSITGSQQSLDLQQPLAAAPSIPYPTLPHTAVLQTS